MANMQDCASDLPPEFQADAALVAVRLLEAELCSVDRVTAHCTGRSMVLSTLNDLTPHIRALAANAFSFHLEDFGSATMGWSTLQSDVDIVVKLSTGSDDACDALLLSTVAYFFGLAMRRRCRDSRHEVEVVDCIAHKQTIVLKLTVGLEAFQMDVKFHVQPTHYQTTLSRYVASRLQRTILIHGEESIAAMDACRAVLLAFQKFQFHLHCLRKTKPIHFVLLTLAYLQENHSVVTADSLTELLPHAIRGIASFVRQRAVICIDTSSTGMEAKISTRPRGAAEFSDMLFAIVDASGPWSGRNMAYRTRVRDSSIFEIAANSLLEVAEYSGDPCFWYRHYQNEYYDLYLKVWRLAHGCA